MKESLFLGVSRGDITPDTGGQLYGYNPYLRSESIHDRLSAAAFYFSYAKEKALLISICVCLINTSLADSLRADISECTGVPAENIFLAATHTHSGPNVSGTVGWGDVDMPYYTKIFKPVILNICKNALQDAEPVSVGSAVGTSQVGVNRRETDINNVTVLGQCPWGCYNPEMTVISFKDNTGKVKANIISYGCHGTAAGPNREITRDWSGIMTDALEKISGGITAFFNGPEGDAGPRLSNGKTVGDITYVEELGKIAAEDAVRIYGQIKEYSGLPASTACGYVKIPLSGRIPRKEAAKTPAL